jgi:hypothetical protein
LKLTLCDKHTRNSLIERHCTGGMQPQAPRQTM